MCIRDSPIPMSYGEDVLEFTNIEAGENICVAGMELNVLKTLDGYDGYLGIGTVSYTHLDVYKRQPLILPCGQALYSRCSTTAITILI